MKQLDLKVMAALLILASTIFGGACSARKQQADTKANSNAESAAEVVEVSTAPVLERSSERGMEVVGSFEAEDEVTVSSQTEGNLVEITVDVGTQVRKGQVIGRLDARELRLKVEQAEASLRQAEARLGIRGGERVDPQRQPDVRQARAAVERARYDWTAAQTLMEKGDISRQQYDVAQRTFEQAEARYEAALENVQNLEAVLAEKRAALSLSKKYLGDTSVVSPITGVVKEKLASRGEYLKAGTPVASIVQINPLRLRLEIPETFAANVRSGQMVTLKVDTFQGREFRGQIKRINPSVDEKNRSLVAEADVANEGGLLKPGMFARAQIASSARGVALMVPGKAVFSLAGINKVFIVDGGRAVERQVKVGAKDGSLVEILEGVKLGEQVITSNVDRLHDGIAVSAS